jgi:uncharacterized protein YkwD
VIRPLVATVLASVTLAAPVTARAAGPDAWFTQRSASPTNAVTATCGWWAPCPTASPPAGQGTSSGATTGPTAPGSASTGAGSSTSGMWGPSPTVTAAPSSGLSGEALTYFNLMNSARVAAGVPPLADNPLLDRLALEKAEDIATYGYFDHYSPRLGWPIDMELRAGFRAVAMGAENIAEAGTVQRALLNFLASPLHRQNLLDPVFTQTGVAVVPIPYGVVVEQLFAGPSE